MIDMDDETSTQQFPVYEKASQLVRVSLALGGVALVIALIVPSYVGKRPNSNSDVDFITTSSINKKAKRVVRRSILDITNKD